MMDVFETIRMRRSVREFRSDPLPEEHMRPILDAARYAPSAGNNQSCRFLVVRNRENLAGLRLRLETWIREKIRTSEPDSDKQRQRLDGMILYLDAIFNAPLMIFVLVDQSTYPQLVFFDGALAAGNLMLAARALGYGTCFQTTYFPEDIVRPYFHTPDDYRLICAIPVGLPTRWPPTPPRKPVTDLVFYERMSSGSAP